MYTPSEKRYERMIYNRCGKSGLKLPAVSLGLWQNFGHKGNFSIMEQMIHTAFDLGNTHFDIANNYGSPYNGSAQENNGLILDLGMSQLKVPIIKCWLTNHRPLTMLWNSVETLSQPAK